MQPLVPLRTPNMFNIRSGPFERAEIESGDYVKWFVGHAYVRCRPDGAGPFRFRD
jgi:hypothetical protein